jgi:hypothetical protein
VKKLKDLQELPESKVGSLRKLAPVLSEPGAPRQCGSPAFPEALKPLCEEPNAEEILQRLGEPPTLHERGWENSLIGGF